MPIIQRFQVTGAERSFQSDRPKHIDVIRKPRARVLIPRGVSDSVIRMRELGLSLRQIQERARYGNQKLREDDILDIIERYNEDRLEQTIRLLTGNRGPEPPAMGMRRAA